MAVVVVVSVTVVVPVVVPVVVVAVVVEVEVAELIIEASRNISPVKNLSLSTVKSILVDDVLDTGKSA